MIGQNSALVKLGPLLVIIFCGNPWIEKITRSFSIVLLVVIDVIISMSIHLECASTSTKKFLPKKEQQNPNAIWTTVYLATPKDGAELLVEMVLILDRLDIA